MHWFRLASCTAVCLCAGLFSVQASSAFDDDRWVPLFRSPNVNDRVRAIVFDDDGHVYVGGCYTAIDGAPGARYIARWDSSSRAWTNLGVSISGPCYGLHLDTNGLLYAVGAFTNACGVNANGIARWDPDLETWANLGAGVDGIIRAIGADSSGRLYVGGGFNVAGGQPANNLACWDGVGWTNLGSGLNGEVFSLLVDTQDFVYVGGLFSEAGGQPAISVARWDGVSWTNLGDGLGDGLNDGVSALAMDSNGVLHAGGYFTHSGTQAMHSVAYWNGAAWTHLGAGLEGAVNTMVFDDEGRLLAGGFFSSAELETSPIHAWDGADWSPLTDDLSGYVIKLAVDPAGLLFVGGDYTVDWNPWAAMIATWDGADWSPLAPGVLDGMIHALCVDPFTNLYVAGEFTGLGGNTNARYVARRDGVTGAWTNLGSGMDGPVQVLLGDADGKIYAGGSFSSAGGVAASGVAVWNPVEAAWSNLGAGVTGPALEVLALLLDGAGGLYVGGVFTNAGGVAVTNVARWDEGSGVWTNLGAGVNHRVHALVRLPDGDVAVGGDFSVAGGVAASCVARWRTVQQAWTNFGSGVPDSVHALALDASSNLYAGGHFTLGATQSQNVARWNPLTGAWVHLDAGLRRTLLNPNTTAYVAGLLGDGEGDLFACGNFATPALGLGRWDDDEWEPLGSGPNNPATAMAMDPLGNLYVAGSFSKAGGKSSPALAKVILVEDEEDEDGDGLPDWWEILYFGGPTNASPGQATSNMTQTVQDAYLIDENPNAAGSAYFVTVPSAYDGSGFRILISTTSPDRVYTLYATTNLTGEPASWVQIGGYSNGAGAALQFIVTNEPPFCIFRTGVGLP